MTEVAAYRDSSAMTCERPPQLAASGAVVAGGELQVLLVKTTPVSRRGRSTSYRGKSYFMLPGAALVPPWSLPGPEPP